MRLKKLRIEFIAEHQDGTITRDIAEDKDVVLEPDEIQSLTAAMVDHYLQRYGQIEVTRRELDDDKRSH